MKTKNILAGMILAVLAVGCADDQFSEAAIARQGTSGRMGHAETGFQAIDIMVTPDGQTNIWQGAIQMKKETAMRDAANRLKEFPGHNVQMIHPADR